jgi:hypothetical protein
MGRIIKVIGIDGQPAVALFGIGGLYTGVRSDLVCTPT